MAASWKRDRGMSAYIAILPGRVRLHHEEACATLGMGGQLAHLDDLTFDFDRKVASIGGKRIQAAGVAPERSNDAICRAVADPQPNNRRASGND